MKVVMLSKALVAGAYQKKLEALAALPAVELLALVPPSWREPGVGELTLEQQFTHGYRMEVLPMWFNGQHHLHFYPRLGAVLRRERPDVFHIDEEAFNPATYHAMRHGVAVGARCCFYNWANNPRRYPPPFAWFEQYAFRHAAHAICGNAEAAHIIRDHGYTGAITVLPQFGVDPDMFSLRPPRPPISDAAPFVVGYLGRVLAAKGLQDLLAALAMLPPVVQLRIVGDGELRPALEHAVQQRGLAQRVTFSDAVPSTAVPQVMHGLDALVLPSRTMPNWKEQFGRVLVEAMSCGVPVVGSSSGEIPNVIGDAGIVFPERNSRALANALRLLLEQPRLRQALAERGRARALAHYTQAALAAQYHAVYQQMLAA